MRCKFYKWTTDGWRCLLIPPEEWKEREEELKKKYCLRNPMKCPIYLTKYLPFHEEELLK